MEKQTNLYLKSEDIQNNDLPKPEIKVVKNTYSIPGGLCKEEVIIKRWILTEKYIALSKLSKHL